MTSSDTRTTFPITLTNRPLVGVFQLPHDTLMPIPILGYREVSTVADSGEQYFATEWIPISHNLASNSPAPVCQSIYEDREVFDALNRDRSYSVLFDFTSVVNAVK